jgi:hypothetical protein
MKIIKYPQLAIRVGLQISYGSSSSPNAPDWLRRISNSKGSPYKIIGAWQERFEEKIKL